MLNKRLPLLIAIAVLLSMQPAIAPQRLSAAENGTDSGLPSRSAAQISDMWNKLMQPSADYRNPYLVAPQSTKPYEAGSLRNDYIQDGVNAVNYYRFISGLPYDVRPTAALNTKAQYGATLLAATGKLSHKPDKPADMPKDFFDKGYASTTSANIYSSYGYNDHIVAHSVDAYIEDSDVGNLDRVGHRRWLLNPPLRDVGFGQAESADGWFYSALQVFDTSRATPPDYHYVAYPAQGAFPIESFGASYAWSVSPNPKEFAQPDPKKVRVTLKRQSDGKTWTLGPGSYTPTLNGAYFNVDNGYIGSGSTIIFRPDGIDAYKSGDKFDVTISGLTTKTGASRTFRYEVAFMSVNETPPAETKDVETHFTDLANHWAKASVAWGVGQGIVSDVNGPFRPNDKVKEEEMLKMLLASQHVAIRSAKDGERWSAAYYDYAANSGYNLAGRDDERLRQLPIDRLAVAELIASAKGLSYTGDDAIRYLLDNGYSKGKTSPTVAGYAGGDTLTRAEAVQFVRNLIEAGYTLEARG